MLCNLEKMPITPLGWPVQLDHHHQQQEPAAAASDSAMPATTAKLMEKPSQEQNQQALRCPRCDSSNTKFCYYNNYSLSQPRHFCKACKRYWTRGGTLRNVPVGGGCRKNKRVKRHAPSASAEPLAPPHSSDITTTTTATTSTYTNAGIYNLASGGAQPTGLSGFSLPVTGSTLSPVGLEGLNLDLPPMLSSMWLNFPNATTPNDHHVDYNHQNPNHIQEPLNSPSLHHDYSFLNSSASSLLTSTLHQPKLMMNMRESRPSTDFQVFFPMGDLHQQVPISNATSSFLKGMKMEQESLSMTTIPNCNNSSSIHETMASDVNTYWNTSGVGANWQEATSYGPSVTSLI